MWSLLSEKGHARRFSACECSYDCSKSEWINEVHFKKKKRLSWTTIYIPVISAHHVDHKPYRKHFLTLTLFKIVFFPASSLCTDVPLQSEGGGTSVHRLPSRHNLKSILNTKWMVVTRHQSHGSFSLDWKCSSRRSSGTVTVTGLPHIQTGVKTSIMDCLIYLEKRFVPKTFVLLHSELTNS